MQLIFPLVLTIALASAIAPARGAQGSLPSERAAVSAAVEDYLLALYEVAPERIERSVHPEIDKIGFWRKTADQDYATSPMSYSELSELAGKWNADGTRANAESPREIRVLATMPEIACATLRAAWGTDVFHLVKEQGRWKIRHVLWQSVADDTQRPTEEDADLLRAGLDYVEAFYEVRPDYLDRSVHPELHKVGRYRPEPDGPSRAAVMDFAGLRALATRWYADQPPPGNAPKVVEVLFALDQIAVLRIVGDWGVDYVNAARFDGHWQIRQVLWESHPCGARAGAARLSAALNTTCPFSGKPVRADSLSEYQGQVIGFCNPDCAAKFAQRPEVFLHQIAEWPVRR